MFKDAGKLIRDARENQDIPLEKISKDLHIRITYLQAIENGRPEILPSPVQGRGFIRMVARYLQLDPNHVLAVWDAPSFDGIAPSSRPAAADSPSAPEPKRNGFPFFPSGKRTGPAAPETDRPSEPASASVTPAQSIYNHIGAQLRERRELLGLPLDEAEKFTNVRAQYLQLLEDGKFDELESSVQARGMLFNYANFLNLNGEDIMIRFANALQLQSAARHFPDGAQKTKKDRQVRKAGPLSRFFTPDLFIGVSVILGVVALAIYSLITIPAYRNREALKNTAVQEYISAAQTGIATPSATPELPTATPTAAEAPGGALINEDWGEIADAEADGTEAVTEIADTETPVPMDGAIQIYIEADQRAFLRVTVDGAIVFVGRTDAGQIYPFSGNEIIEVETGNASALRIQYNNRNLGTIGNYGEVKKIVFSESLIQTSTPVISPTPSETFELTYTVQSDVATPTVTITPYIP